MTPLRTGMARSLIGPLLGFEILAPEEAAIVPFLFNPIEVDLFTEYCGLWARDGQAQESVEYGDKYFVRADCDRDRPQ